MVYRRLLPALSLLVVVVAAVAAAAATRTINADSLVLLSATSPNGSATAVANVGDVNEDGRPDVAIGTGYRAIPALLQAGTVHVLFGSKASGAIDLDRLGERGFAVIGGRSYRAGVAVAGAGDVNGDGRSDILLSAPRKRGVRGPGSAFVVYGKPDGAPIDLARLSPDQGFEIVGIGSSLGPRPADVAGPGDIDDDGFADLLVTTVRGGAAVVYGSRRPERIDLRRLGSRGFRIIAGRSIGLTSAARAGDANGDRRPDLLLGARSVPPPGQRRPPSSAFVVFGRHHTGTLNLRRLGGRGFRIGGLAAGLEQPSVAGVGDINADRRADVLVVRDSGGRRGAKAEADVVFGSASTRAVDVGHLGARGFRIIDQRGRGLLGPVAGLGDLNGDRIPDLGLNATSAIKGHSESAIVVYGRRATSTLSLDDLDAAGFELAGSPPVVCVGGDGRPLTGAGDFDGDGRRDVLLAANNREGCSGNALILRAPGSSP